MRKEKNKDESYKVWLTTEEIDKAINTAESLENRYILEAMGKAGLRVGVLNNLSYGDIRRTQDGDNYILTVSNAKDVSGEYENGKQRDIYCPKSLERTMFKLRYKKNKDIDQDLLDISKRAVQYRFDNVMEVLAQESGNKDYELVSPHDLRRSYVTDLIHNKNVQISIVKNQMGWENISTVNNYLDKPSESVILDEFTDGQ